MSVITITTTKIQLLQLQEFRWSHSFLKRKNFVFVNLLFCGGTESGIENLFSSEEFETSIRFTWQRKVAKTRIYSVVVYFLFLSMTRGSGFKTSIGNPTIACEQQTLSTIRERQKATNDKIMTWSIGPTQVSEHFIPLFRYCFYGFLNSSSTRPDTTYSFHSAAI